MAHSILGRIGQLVRANVGALVEGAEDPPKAVDQLLRDYAESVRDAEASVAQTIGNLRLLEDDLAEARGAVAEWGDKAAAASRKADELRAAGQAAEADRFDDLARVALRRQIAYEAQARTLEAQVAQQGALTDTLKQGLEQLRLKQQELLRKRDELVSRSSVARARVRVEQAASALDPAGELGRFEERVRREEALAQGLAEAARDPLDDAFARLAADDDERQVDQRLARLKATPTSDPLPGR
jgi:phage shock protein A